MEETLDMQTRFLFIQTLGEFLVYIHTYTTLVTELLRKAMLNIGNIHLHGTYFGVSWENATVYFITTKTVVYDMSFDCYAVHFLNLFMLHHVLAHMSVCQALIYC